VLCGLQLKGLLLLQLRLALLLKSFLSLALIRFQLLLLKDGLLVLCTTLVCTNQSSTRNTDAHIRISEGSYTACTATGNDQVHSVEQSLWWRRLLHARGLC
jgi:hypothetical protein